MNVYDDLSDVLGFDDVNEIFLHNEIFSTIPVHVIEAQHIREIIVYIHVNTAIHLGDINVVAV